MRFPAVIPVLETKRIRIRPMQISDAPAMFSYMSDPAVSQYLTWYPHRSLDDTVRYTAMATFTAQNGGVVEWVFENKNTKTVIGNGGFTSFDTRHVNAELSFLLSRDFWNKGIMTEVLNALLAYGFHNGLHRIEAQCIPENKVSQALLHKVGFHKEGVLRQKMFIKRRFRDIIVYGMLKDDFCKHKEDNDEGDY